MSSTTLDDALDHPYKIAAVASALVERGFRMEDALAGTGLARTDLTNPDKRVSPRQLLQVCGNAMRMSSDPALAISAGKRMSIVHFGMYGYALLSCPTAREAIQFALKYRPLAVPVIGLGYDVRNGMPGWVFTDQFGLGENTALFRFVMEFQIGTLMSLHEEILGEPLPAREVSFRAPAPADIGHYAALLQCPVRFGQQDNALRFDSGAQNRQIAHGNPQAVAAIAQTCDRLLAQLRGAHGAQSGVVHDVRKLLLREPGRFPGLEQVASELHTTSRTLRRKLLAQGTSFQSLQGDIRRQLSMDYLRQTDMTAEDIAIAVGFNDAAALRRAFRRWTGTSPGAWRQRERGAAAGVTTEN